MMAVGEKRRASRLEAESNKARAVPATTTTTTAAAGVRFEDLVADQLDALGLVGINQGLGHGVHIRRLEKVHGQEGLDRDGGILVAGEHFLGRLEPALQPVIVAPLCDTGKVRAQLLALPDRVAGEALALERKLAGDGIGGLGCGLGSRHVVVFEVFLRGFCAGRDQADGALRCIGEVMVDHDVGTFFRDHEFDDGAVRRTEQHRLHAAELVVGIALEPDAVEDGADDVKARRAAGADVEHEQAHALAGFCRQRLLHHAVVLAVEYGVGRLRLAHVVAIQHVERLAITAKALPSR